MINTENIRLHVCRGLREYLSVPVVRANQNEKPPKGSYLVYTITTLESENKGTYGKYEDGIDRKPVTQTWSFSAISATYAESMELACRAREWLDYCGTTYLNDNDVICQSCTAITDRSNVLSVEYEYKCGFDAVFWGFSEVQTPTYAGAIETVAIGGLNIEKGYDTDALNALLEERLDGDTITESTLGENVVRVIADLDDIEKALEESGIVVPDNAKTETYGDRVRQLGNSLGMVTLTKFTEADLKGGDG